MLNRREFIKSGLSGLFGAFLTWAGTVKAEEPEDPLDAMLLDETGPIEKSVTASVLADTSIDLAELETTLQALLAQEYRDFIDEEFEELCQGHGTGEPIGLLTQADIVNPDPIVQLEQALIAELSEATKVKIAIDFEASWNNPELIYVARAVFYSNLVGEECMAFCDFPDELLHSVETPLLTDIIATQLRRVFRDGELDQLALITVSDTL